MIVGMCMEFCSECGSRMLNIKGGFKCPKCGKVIHAKAAVQSKSEKRKDQADYIFVSASKEESYTKVLRRCPGCGNKEAMHWFSGVSGEHAGIMRERIVEHFKCTRCSHSWAESS